MYRIYSNSPRQLQTWTAHRVHVIQNVYHTNILLFFFYSNLAHEMAQAVVHRERYGWPPDSPWGLFQPTRPEETEKIAVKEEQ